MTAAIEIAGLRKTFGGSRHATVASTGSTWSSNPAGCTASSARTAPARPPRSARCSAWSTPTPARCACSASRSRTALPDDASVRSAPSSSAPQFFPFFSGRRNLRLLAGVAGVQRKTVDEALEIVGLRDRAGDRVKGYSLGMKQRLAIAATLLKSPELLILDEPNNGLDPAGIREVRDLMRALADPGTTVLLSVAHPRRGPAGLRLRVDHLARPARRRPARWRRCWPPATRTTSG